MRKILLSALLFSSISVHTLYADTQPAPLSLLDCYTLALKQSEQLAIRQKEIDEARARFTQALSTILPNVSFIYSEEYQDKPASPGSSFRRETPQARFTFSQPLFSGFKEFAAMNASRAEGRQFGHLKKRAEQLLLTDVVSAFYLYLGYQEEFETMNLIRQALLDRMDELKKREELGRTRPSEVASAESRLSRVEADLELVASQAQVSKELLEFLVGKTVGSITDESPAPALTVDVKDIPYKAQNRPDVQAAREAFNKSKSEIGVAKAEIWPQVSLDGNYYEKRVGSSEDIDWDVMLAFEVPLFKGGENIGKIKEARAVSDQEYYRFQETERTAILEINNARTKFESSTRRLAAMEKALKAAEKNFQLQIEDYRLNLVNNLEVLQAIEELEEIRRSFIQVKNEHKQNYWGLKIALGDPIP